MKFSKEKSRKRIHRRIRKKVNGTSSTPRLNVYRSNKAIYCQLIDDVQGHTLSTASSLEEGMPTGTPKIEVAKAVGKKIATKAADLNITSVVFDRGGYLYHGRIKALAEGAREGGLQF